MNATAIHQTRSARTEQILKAVCAGVLVLIVAGAVLTSVLATSNTSRAALHTTRSAHVDASAPTHSSGTSALRIPPTISNGASGVPANQTATSNQTGASSSGSATETCLGATAASLEQAVTQIKLPEYLGAEIATPNEVTVTAVIDPQDPCWARYSMGPAPGYETQIQGAYGFGWYQPDMSLSQGSWSLSNFGTAYVGCPGDSLVVPAQVLAYFGSGPC
jgi:hypothetical protein